MFPFYRRQGGRILLKQSSNKQKSVAALLWAESRTRSVSFYCQYCKSRVTWSGLLWGRYQSDVVHSRTRCSGSGTWFAATALGNPAQAVLSWPKISDPQSARIHRANIRLLSAPPVVSVKMIADIGSGAMQQRALPRQWYQPAFRDASPAAAKCRGEQELLPGFLVVL